MSKQSSERVLSLRNFYESRLAKVHVPEAVCMNCRHYAPQEYQSCAQPCVDHALFEEKRQRPVRQIMRKIDVVDHFYALYGPPVRDSSQ